MLPFELYLSLRKVYFGPDYVNRPIKASSITVGEEEETEDHYQLKSFLNIIADSGVVETYLLTKADMAFLPDSELKLIFDWIVQ